MANEIIKIKDAAESQLKKTDEIIASNEAVADMISEINNAISEVNNTLTSGFTMLGAGLQELCFITEDGFREVIDRLDLQNKTLDAIKEILEKPLDTQAKELRKRAETAYLNNWYDEAEMDLLEAEKKNYQDFIVHQILGNIYYYHKKNYTKSLEYYQKAAKYATPVSKKHASNALICAAIAYYQLGQLSDAYKSTGAAFELLREDPHVLYNHARYAAKTGYEFTGLLKECVYKDPKYLAIADTDNIFSDRKGEIKKLAEDLRNEKRNAVNNLIQKIDTAKREAKAVGINDFTSLDKQLVEINKLCARGFIDCVEAEQMARSAYDRIRKIWEDTLAEWIKDKNNVVSELKLSENKISDNMVIWGFVATILVTYLLGVIIFITDGPKKTGIGDILMIMFAPITLPLAGFGALLSGEHQWIALVTLGIPLVTFVIVRVVIKSIKLNAVRNQIEKVENNITELKNDITRL